MNAPLPTRPCGTAPVVSGKRMFVVTPAGLLVALISCLFPLVAPAQKVAIYTDDSSFSYRVDVHDKIESSGLFESVDIYQLTSTIPTLEQLRAYQAILFFSNGGSFWDQTAMGDVLADYVESGGGVVAATFSFSPGALQIRGRMESAGYLPFSTGAYTSSVNAALSALLPAHAILSGVTNFSGGTSSFRNRVTVTNGANEIARWSDGLPLIAAFRPAEGRVVGLNFFPPSSNARSDFWPESSDGKWIMANALKWAATARPRPRVAVVVTGPDGPLADVHAKLLSSRRFRSVSTWNVVSNGVPSLGTLRPYDGVLVCSSPEAAWDGAALGDVLADYMDAGGGVVITAYATLNNLSSGMGGRILSANYLPFVPGPGALQPGLPLALQAEVPGHPLLRNILSFTRAITNDYVAITTGSNATLVARWNNGAPLILTSRPAHGRIVALNVPPASTEASPSGWDSATDGKWLLANALEYVSRPVVGVYGAASAIHATDIQYRLDGLEWFATCVSSRLTSVPSVAELTQYDSVMVYTSTTWDSVTLGNNLHAYLNATNGGGVVLASFAFGDVAPTGGVNYGIGGGFEADDCSPFSVGGPAYVQANMIADQTNHPLLRWVRQIDNGTGGYMNGITLKAGSDLVAHWDDVNSRPLVATRKAARWPIVGLNFYPASSEVLSGGWQAHTDGEFLIGNALYLAAAKHVHRVEPPRITVMTAIPGTNGPAISIPLDTVSDATYRCQWTPVLGQPWQTAETFFGDDASHTFQPVGITNSTGFFRFLIGIPW